MATSDDMTAGSEPGMERILAEAEKESGTTTSQAVTPNLEGVELMVDDQNELVDLDALFDALNVAAEEHAEAISFEEGHGQALGVVTVSSEAFAAGSLEEVSPAAEEIMKDQIISDES